MESLYLIVYRASRGDCARMICSGIVRVRIATGY